MENETVTESPEATAEGVEQTSEAQSAEVQESEGTPAQAEAKPAKVSDTERLKELVKKSKDEEEAQTLSQDDLDFLEKYDFGNKPPKEEKKPKTEKKPEEAEAEEKPVKADPLADVLKELGAKEAKDILPKVKELRKQLTGKDAQAVARLTRDVETLTSRVKNEIALFEDVRAGKPQAIAHFEKAYGLKLANSTAKPADSKGMFDRDKALDPEFADEVNSVIGGLREELRTVREQLEARAIKESEASAQTEATRAAIDEMVNVAGLKGLESLAQIPNLRQAIKEWYAGKDDPRFEVFDQIMSIANEKKTDLETAWAVLRARGADLEIAKAKQEGRAEAYNQRPSKTLSGMQGKGQSEYTNFTDAQFQEMSENPRKIPEEWFDENDQLVSSRVPKRGHKWLFPSLAKE